jgi:hypothetical protein
VGFNRLVERIRKIEKAMIVRLDSEMKARK